MANALKCDRCGAFYVPPAYRRKIEVTVVKNFRLYTLDLCDKCTEELREFIYRDKEVGNDNGKGTVEENDC